MEEDKDWVRSVEVATAPKIDLGDYSKYIQAGLKKHAKVHNHDVKDGEKGKTPTQEEEKAHKLNVIFDALLDNS
jgi:hypothetical protein